MLSYVESVKKTVQTTLLPGQKQRCRHREMDTWTQEGEGEAGVNWEIRIDRHTLSCVRQIVGTSWIAQGAQLRAL